MTSSYVLQQVTQERYNELNMQYSTFLAAASDPSKDPVSLYRPRNEKMVKELELIREISKELMKKKEEDMKRAAQAAQEIKEEKSEDAEEKPEAEETQQEEKEE